MNQIKHLREVFLKLHNRNLKRVKENCSKTVQFQIKSSNKIRRHNKSAKMVVKMTVLSLECHRTHLKGIIVTLELLLLILLQ